MDLKIMPFSPFTATPNFNLFLRDGGDTPPPKTEKPAPLPRLSKAERIAKAKESLCKQGLLSCVLAKGPMSGLWAWATTPSN